MLIGLGGKKKAEASLAESKASASSYIFDVNVQDFETRVIQASLVTPVLVDFWAPWCGPCKQLTPVLEQAVEAAGGKILLAKINIDDNPELAQAMRVQSVPTVYAFFQGQPVTAFAGARPASEIKSLIDQLTKLVEQAQPDALDIPAVLAQAGSFLAEGKTAEAQDIYIQVLEQDENNAGAYAGLVRTLIAMNALDQARSMIDDVPDAIKDDAVFKAAEAAVTLAENRPDESVLNTLLQKVAANPDDHDSRFDLGMAQFGAGQAEAAIDTMLEIVRRNRGWEEEKARKQVLQFFDALGPMDPQTMAGRRKLSSLLFS